MNINNRLIECVPNFSEGRNMHIIKQIAEAIEQVDNVKLLHIDSGRATNRTVITFVGIPEAVVEAAFRAIQKAAELIDMRHHKGEHPRMGAIDVCPLIPLRQVSMEETVKYAHQLGERVGRELGIPVYLYEYAATRPERKNLANIRAGEYEGIPEKIQHPEWKPDYGPAIFNEKTGNIAIGARDFLIAYNVNLNTTSVRQANAVAFDVRENGRIKKDAQGNIVFNQQGEPERIPGTCKGVKAIGWYIKEYGIAQVSMNITNIHLTPLHLAFEEVCKSAQQRGMRVTGSELIGLVPLQCLIDAGKYFLKKQQRSTGVPEKELIKIAIKSLGLDELGKFEPQKRIIEYLIEDASERSLVDMTLRDFADEVSSESPAPGGGSVAACLGALAASLGAMVANLSAAKKGWENLREQLSEHAEKGQHLKDTLLRLIEEDARSFTAIMQAYQLPKNNEAEVKNRNKAIEKATLSAIETPLYVMQLSLQALELIHFVAEKGNPNSVSDAGVGALCARSAAYGAYLNVKINCKSLSQHEKAQYYLQQAESLLNKALAEEEKILKIVKEKM